MSPAEQLHDLSTRRRRLTVRVLGGPIHDLVLAMWSAFGGNETSATHEIGARWFADLRAGIPEETREAMAGFGGDRGHVWAIVLGLLSTAEVDAEDPEAVFGWLESSEFAGSVRTALSDLCWEVDAGTVAAAASGDDVAMSTCLEALGNEEKHRALESFFRFPVNRLGGEIAETLRAVRQAAFLETEKTWAPAIAASVRAVRLQTGLDAVDLIERVTNGITRDIPLGTSELILVPSVSIRPWTLVLEHGTSLVMIYPVADEHLAADSDSPPGWLVNYHRALGDSRRLRMLRHIAEREASLADLTELVGLAKSTVFHHIGVLRSAGLVRVRITNDTTVYTLRRAALPDARAVLDTYLFNQTSKEGTS